MNAQLLLPVGRAVEAEGPRAHRGHLRTLTGSRDYQLNSAFQAWGQKPELKPGMGFQGNPILSEELRGDTPTTAPL